MTEQDVAMQDVTLRSVRRHRVGVVLPLVAIAVAVVLAVAAWNVGQLSEEILFSIGGMISFTTVGALIEDRRPGQSIGRICLLIGMSIGVATLCYFAAITLDSLPGRLPPLGAAFAVIADTMRTLAFLIGIPLLISRFPNGREPGRLAVLVDGLLAVSGAVILTSALRPGPIDYGWLEPVDNPLAITGIPFVDSGTAFTTTLLAYGLGSLFAFVGLVRRYAHGSSVVRAQIRWFAAAIGISIGLFALLIVTSGDEALNGAVASVWIPSLLLPPIAIGVAILRYRLYDIDRIISNAIGYGLVSLVLFGVFAAVNLTLVSNVSPLVNNSGIAVAASTLLVAALFNPVRVRVQRVVDRRFHRARYDAEQTVAGFASRLRDEVDLPTLARALDATVRRAIAPSSVGLWLRGGR